MTNITKERVRVSLRVRLSPEAENIKEISLQNEKYFLAVTGPGLQLGFCDHNRAPRMTPTGHAIWTKDIWILKNTTLTYKYLVVQRYTNEVLHCEKIATREKGVGVTPLTIDDTYNRVQFSFNKVYYGDCVSTTHKYDKMSAHSGDGREEVVSVTEERQKTDASNDPADVNNNVVKASEDLSAFPVEDAVNSEAPANCQSDRENENISPSRDDRKKNTYTNIVGKVGLVAIVAFSVYKFVLKR